MSKLDKIYRSAINSTFFSKGWGKPELLLQLIENFELVRDRTKFSQMAHNFRPIMIESRVETKKCIEIEGSFVSPLDSVMPRAMDEHNRICRFQMVWPKERTTSMCPICLHYAGTGDH